MGTKKLGARDNQTLKTEFTTDELQSLISTLTNPRIAEAKKKKLFETKYHIDAVHDGTGRTLLSAACRLRYFPLAKWLVDAGADVNKAEANGPRPLIVAVQVSLEMTKLLVEAGARLDSDSDTGTSLITPLMQSILANQYPSFIYLLLKGADINFRAAENVCPLYVAAQQKEIKFLVQLLRQKGIIIDNLDSEGNTPLFTAVDKMNLEAVKLLLQAGADLYHRNEEKVTVFHIAAAKGDDTVLKVLLEHRAKYPEASIDDSDNDGNTPLLTAVLHKNIEAVKLLLQASAHIFHQNKKGQSVFHIVTIIGDNEILKLLLEHKVSHSQASIDISDSDGNTPLQLAVYYRRVRHTQLFLEAGASPTIQNNNHFSPLASIVASAKGKVFDENEKSIFKLLIQFKADVNQLHTVEGSTITPLCIAIRNGKTGIAFVLLQHGANPVQEVQVLTESYTTISGDDPRIECQEIVEKTTPLHLAANCQMYEVVEAMIAREVNVNVLDGTNFSPLMHACLRGDTRMIIILLDAAADPNLANNRGETPFWMICASGTVEQVNLFFNSRYIKPNVNTHNLQGNAPLHVVAERGRLPIVKVLCQKGATVNKTAQDGTTPLFMAAQEGHYDVVDYLLSQAADADIRRVEGSSPLEIAVKYNHTKVVNRLLEDRISKEKRTKVKVHIEGQDEIITEDGSRMVAFFLSDPSLVSKAFTSEPSSKPQSSHAYLKEKELDPSEVKKPPKVKRRPLQSALSSQAVDIQREKDTNSGADQLSLEEEGMEGENQVQLVESASSVEQSKGIANKKCSSAAETPSLQPPAPPMAIQSPTPGKLEIIYRGPINFKLASLSNLSAVDSPTGAAETRLGTISTKPPLQVDSSKSPLLIDQILQEASALSFELNPPKDCINPLLIVDDIDRLSLRYDTFQLFHKIYLLINNVHQNIVTLSPDDPLAETLKAFCDTVRKFRNMMIHRPNYVDGTFEEEVKHFVLKSGLIEWCRELHEYSNKPNILEEKPSAQTASIVSGMFLTVAKRIVSLKSYQQLEDSWNKKITFEECYEQLLFAIKCMAFKEEKSENPYPHYYKLRRNKALAMLVTIVDEYGFNAEAHLSADSFNKLKATPLYQEVIRDDKVFGTKRVTFLDACHHFRNKKVSHLAEESIKRDSASFNAKDNLQLKELKNRAKEACKRLGVEHINDSVKAVDTTPTELPPPTRRDASSHEKILSSLHYDAQVLTFVTSRLNPNVPEFKPQNPPALVVDSSSLLMPPSLSQVPVDSDKRDKAVNEEIFNDELLDDANVQILRPY